MIEIIPNWHPIFVHFTIGLLSISALLYLVGALLKKENLLLVARWNLWIGAIITIGTVLAGWYAYNTIAHNHVSHSAMTDHRNWALTTAVIFILLALWAFWKQRAAKKISASFIVVILLAAVLLITTSYKGGELVYRHGLGVMRLPNSSNQAHGHNDHTYETERKRFDNNQGHYDHHGDDSGHHH